MMVAVLLLISFQCAMITFAYRYVPTPVGLWPMYGNNRESQQISSSGLNRRNIKKIEESENCTYTSPGSISYYGYITVDNDNNGYVADSSGYIFKFDLDSCDIIWRVNIGTALGYDAPIISRNSPTLYDETVLIGAPNGRHLESPIASYPFNEPCFAIGFNKYDGSVVFSIDLNHFDLDGDGMNDIDDLQSLVCHVHGFIVDKNNEYAYGGMSSVANFIAEADSHAFQGRMYKINLFTHKVEDVFYTFPDNNGEIKDSYRGGSSWNFPVLISEYLVFGTGQLYSYPDRIGQCLLNSENDPSLIPPNNYPYNHCGDLRSDNQFWRCLEDDVYIDSLIVVNRNNFNIESITRTMGVDAWIGSCRDDADDCPIVPGPDLDVTAISTYKTTKGELIAITTTKASQFIAINIKTGKVLISKRTGIAYLANSVWASALEPNKQIALSTYSGDVVGRYILPNGDVTCETGTVSAIDLKTGKTKWIFVVPYGRINDCDDPKYDSYVDTGEHGDCTISPDGTRYIDDSKAKVIIPPISDRLPVNSVVRSRIYGGVTISNGLVYIPTATGDVYVLRLRNGKFVTRFECPEVEYEGQYNRAGIHGGVTVVDKRVIFYCGARFIFGIDDSEHGNIIVSINFDPQMFVY